MSDNCKCSVPRETVQSVIQGLQSCRPRRPDSLLVRAWGLGLLLVAIDLGLMLLIMASFPPNIITLPLVLFMFIGILPIVLAVSEGYDRCHRKCRGW